jgi:predicted small integral membrane protein
MWVFFGIVFFLMGATLIAGSYYNWDWFMNIKGRIDMVELLGRNGDRIFNAVVGLAFIVLGILMTVGIAHP